jgi:hypothetical protein
MVMTILPRAWPSIRSRMAVATSLRGYVRSMAGISLPASMRSRKAIRSAAFSDEMKVPSFG